MSTEEATTIAEIITDLRDHANDALAEIGEPGSGWPQSLRDESYAFTRVADWLAERYQVDEEVQLNTAREAWSNGMRAEHARTTRIAETVARRIERVGETVSTELAAGLIRRDLVEERVVGLANPVEPETATQAERDVETLRQTLLMDINYEAAEAAVERLVAFVAQLRNG